MEKVEKEDNANIISLKEKLKKKGEKISDAKRIRNLITKQKGWIKKHDGLTDFKEPLVFLHRRSGNMEIYEDATMGKFIITHSTGKERAIDLTQSKQETMDYAGKKIRFYDCHEDFPFAGREEPIVNAESIALGIEQIKKTNLKYEQSLQKLKNSGKMIWVWVILGIVGAFIALAILVPASFWDRIFKTGEYAVNKTAPAPPIAGIILFLWRKMKNE